MITEDNMAIFIIELAAVALDYTLGLVLLSKTLKLAASAPRRYYFGVFGFFLTHSACRTVFLARSYFVDTSMPLERSIMFDVGTTLGLVCVLLLVVAIELTLFTRSRKTLSFLGFVGLGMMVVDLFLRLTIGPYRLLLWVHYFTTPTLTAFIIAIYLRALLKASGNVRTNAIVMLVAIVLLSLSELSNSTIASQLIPGATYLGPTLMAASLFMLYYAVVHLSIWKKTGQPEQESGNRAAET
jgi:hypothetical protein